MYVHSCHCISFCIAWFEVGFKIDLNLLFEFALEICLRKRKKEFTPLFLLLSFLARSALFPHWPSSLPFLFHGLLVQSTGLLPTPPRLGRSPAPTASFPSARPASPPARPSPPAPGHVARAPSLHPADSGSPPIRVASSSLLRVRLEYYHADAAASDSGAATPRCHAAQVLVPL